MAISSGFNADDVTAAINGVNKAKDSLMRVLVDGFNNQFVSPMGDVWACKQAVEFFAAFKEVMDDLVTKADSTFQSVVDTLNQAGANWAAKTGNEGAFTKIPYTNYSKRLVVDSIQENINGNRGANPAGTRSTLAVFNALAMNVSGALTLAANAVAKSGFLGGEQQSNLTSSLNAIKTDIKNTMDDITNSAKEKISESIDKYGELESTTAATFTVSSK